MAGTALFLSFLTLVFIQLKLLRINPKWLKLLDVLYDGELEIMTEEGVCLKYHNMLYIFDIEKDEDDDYKITKCMLKTRTPYSAGVFVTDITYKGYVTPQMRKELREAIEFLRNRCGVDHKGKML